MKKGAFKPVNLKTERWQEIKDLSEELAAERGIENISLPDVIGEAIKFFKENRPKT
jgi:hypothetical protein